jgi:hypothetical protein
MAHEWNADLNLTDARKQEFSDCNRGHRARSRLERRRVSTSGRRRMPAAAR